MATVLWFTGLSGAGKTTIAELVADGLRALGKSVKIIDGDSVRDTIHKHLGFTAEDITENNRLIAELAKQLMKNFDFILVPIISPFERSRMLAKKIIGDGFLELYVESHEDVRVARDPKGLYKKAQEGHIKNLIGYGGVAYEVPKGPDIVVNTDTSTPAENAANILKFLNVL